jgi:hypothetical protein
MSRLPRQYGILDISQHYRLPRPAKGIALFFFFGILFIVCNVPFNVCVALCAVLFESSVLFCVICAFLCVVSYCSTTATW